MTDTGGTANGGIDASAVQTFMISVGAVNHAPSDIGLAGTTVIENSAVGTTVGTLTIDVDGDTTFTYQLVAGVGGDDNAFTIVGNTLKTAGTFDFEAKSVTVSACNRPMRADCRPLRCSQHGHRCQ